MNYLIVFLILLLVVAPIVSILPSKRQKQQMIFRRDARAAGINVALVKIDDPDSDKEKYLSATGRPLPKDLNCVAYRKPRKKTKNWSGDKLPDWVMVRDKSGDGHLRWQGDSAENIDPGFRQAVEEWTTRLPADIVRIDETSQLVSIYWHEHSDEQGLQNIFQFLNFIVTLSPCLQKDSSADGESEVE